MQIKYYFFLILIIIKTINCSINIKNTCKLINCKEDYDNRYLDFYGEKINVHSYHIYDYISFIKNQDSNPFHFLTSFDINEDKARRIIKPYLITNNSNIKKQDYLYAKKLNNTGENIAYNINKFNLPEHEIEFDFILQINYILQHMIHLSNIFRLNVMNIPFEPYNTRDLDTLTSKISDIFLNYALNPDSFIVDIDIYNSE